VGGLQYDLRSADRAKRQFRLRNDGFHVKSLHSRVSTISLIIAASLVAVDTTVRAELEKRSTSATLDEANKEEVVASQTQAAVMTARLAELEYRIDIIPQRRAYIVHECDINCHGRSRWITLEILQGRRPPIPPSFSSEQCSHASNTALLSSYLSSNETNHSVSSSQSLAKLG
jgi:hypothetical protein